MSPFTPHIYKIILFFGSALALRNHRFATDLKPTPVLLATNLFSNCLGGCPNSASPIEYGVAEHFLPQGKRCLQLYRYSCR